MKLPGTGNYEVERYGGAGRSEWVSRFAEVDGELDSAKKSLVEAQQKLDALAGDSGGWQMAPPGAQSGDAGPVSYELLQEIRRHKEEVEVAERRRRELVVEASLAGVPEEVYR
jgi:hypothetical protein